MPHKLGLNPDQKRVKDRMMKDDIKLLNANDQSEIQARVKSRIGENRVKDPMMKNDSGV